MPDEIQITAHCLLRLSTALLLEVGGIDHGHSCATDELNRLSGRSLPPKEWLLLLQPLYCARFCPTADSVVHDTPSTLTHPVPLQP
jgi:hypothetical protein